MTYTPTEDDCLEFAKKVRWLTGVDIPQFVAGRYLVELREKYASDAQRVEWGLDGPEKIRSFENGPVWFGADYGADPSVAVEASVTMRGNTVVAAGTRPAKRKRGCLEPGR